MGVGHRPGIEIPTPSSRCTDRPHPDPCGGTAPKSRTHSVSASSLPRQHPPPNPTLPKHNPTDSATRIRPLRKRGAGTLRICRHHILDHQRRIEDPVQRRANDSHRNPGERNQHENNRRYHCIGFPACRACPNPRAQPRGGCRVCHRSDKARCPTDNQAHHGRAPVTNELKHHQSMILPILPDRTIHSHLYSQPQHERSITRQLTTMTPTNTLPVANDPQALRQATCTEELDSRVLDHMHAQRIFPPRNDRD